MLVAIALFLAQSINFALLLSGRRQLRQAQFVTPVVNRVVDTLERDRGTPMPFQDRWHSRIRIAASDPVTPDMQSSDKVEDAVRKGLKESDISFTTVHAGIGKIGERQHLNDRRRNSRFARYDRELRVGVQVEGRGWFTFRAPWPRGDVTLLWPLIAQTLILYIITLVPLLWVGRRMARPLQSLATAARQFDPSAKVDPLEEHGPEDVRAVTRAFNGLSDRVRAMLEEKDRMLGAIGHDLRTPLAALRVRIESVEDEQDRARMADIIEEMNHTLEDILSLARLGRPSEAATEVDLSALVDAVVEDFRDIGADVTAEESPRLPIRLRPALMRRAVRNLIENAVKYGVSAEVRLVPSPQEVRIEIADHGPGIPPDKLAAVFDPFTRLESSRNRETGGIGLGLALARAIVHDAGGEILLDNRDGGGLLATIRLPRG
nr:ATP-binding protein [Stakelama sediminis]